MSSAREEILGRIRAATGGANSAREGDYLGIARAYRQGHTWGQNEILACFIDRLQDYGCGVYRCADHEIAATIGDSLRREEKRSLLIPGGLPRAWLPSHEFEFVEDTNLSYEELRTTDSPDAAKSAEVPLLFGAAPGGLCAYEEIELCEGVLTGCAIAIGLTGTIVLQHTAERRALTLIPDYHLCVVFEDQVVESVPEAVRAMRDFGTVPLTTISGPSATADIEMTRIKGVHGPRTLDVILVSSASR